MTCPSSPALYTLLSLAMLLVGGAGLGFTLYNAGYKAGARHTSGRP